MTDPEIPDTPELVELIGLTGAAIALLGGTMVAMWAVWTSLHEWGFLPTAVGVTALGLVVFLLAYVASRR